MSVPAILLATVLFVALRSGGEKPELPSELSPEVYEQAAREYRRQHGRSPALVDTLDWIAEREARAAEGDLELAVACFAAIPSDHPLYGHSARHQQGQVLLRLNRAVEAEEQFREFLALESESSQRPRSEVVDAIQRLRYVLEVELRFEERAALLHDLVLAGEGDQHDTLFYCFHDLLFWNGSKAFRELRNWHEAAPDDFHSNVALGRYLVARGDLDEGARVLDACSERWPGDLRVIAARLEYLDAVGETERFDRLAGQLPPVSDDDPWLLLRQRGRYHNRRGEPRKAIDCFRRLLAADAASNSARLGLAEAYRLSGEADLRDRMLEEAKLLARIQNLLGRNRSDETGVDAFLEIARLSAEAGLADHAMLVARLALRMAPGNADAALLVEDLAARSDEEPS